jgi:adenylate cyclase
MARMGLAMLAAKDEIARHFGITVRMRIGIASGPVMAGVIGTRKFSYDVWGDAVNLAARLESSGEPERVQVSAETRAALTDPFACEWRGRVEIKGLGPLETWFLIDPRDRRPAAARAAS